MKKIDIHVHTRAVKGIPRAQNGMNYVTPEELSEIYEKLGIEKGVIMPRTNPECGWDLQTNEDAAAMAHKYPDMFYWFCDIDPRMGRNSPDTDLSYFLEYYRSLGAKGVGEICCNLYFDDPMVENLFYHCEKTGIPITFHIGPQIGGCYGLVDETGLPRLERELQKFPGLKFLGHSQPFWAEIGTNVTMENRNGYPEGKINEGRVVELMRKYPNLYGDVSAFSGFNAIARRDPEYGYEFIEEFQDRLFFGTDIVTPSEPKLSYWLDNAVKEGRISETAYQKICRGNALKLLGEDLNE